MVYFTHISFNNNMPEFLNRIFPDQPFGLALPRRPYERFKRTAPSFYADRRGTRKAARVAFCRTPGLPTGSAEHRPAGPGDREPLAWRVTAERGYRARDGATRISKPEVGMGDAWRHFAEIGRSYNVSGWTIPRLSP
jgi:hypothetical protein